MAIENCGFQEPIRLAERERERPSFLRDPTAAAAGRMPGSDGGVSGGITVAALSARTLRGNVVASE